MMRVVDTSLLYAFFNRADAHHEEARAAFRQPAPVGVPASVLQETLDLIRFRHGKRVALEAYHDLCALPHVRLLQAPAEKAVADLWSRREALSHADAGAVVTAWREDADLLTADAKQRAAFRSGP